MEVRLLVPGGQHTKPVEAVNELADCLAVASQVFRQFHVGSRHLSHLQTISTPLIL